MELENMDVTVANVLLKSAAEQAIREAVILQRKADNLRIEQDFLKNKWKPYSYVEVVRLDDGVRALSNVLQKALGVKQMDIRLAIQKIAADNWSKNLGFDDQNYIELFTVAYWEVI